jgi:hypothetical protein
MRMGLRYLQRSKSCHNAWSCMCWECFLWNIDSKLLRRSIGNDTIRPALLIEEYLRPLYQIHVFIVFI